MAAGPVAGYEPEGSDELDKQKGTFKTTLVRPDADFSRWRTKIQPNGRAGDLRRGRGQRVLHRSAARQTGEGKCGAGVRRGRRVQAHRRRRPRFADLAGHRSRGGGQRGTYYLILQPVITDGLFNVVQEQIRGRPR